MGDPGRGPRSVNRLDEAERLIDKYDCRCGSGGSLACDDDCPGDVTPHKVREAMRLIIAELRSLRETKQAELQSGSREAESPEAGSWGLSGGR